MTACTEDRFLKEVSNHEMTIIRDSGVDRHIRFRKPGTFCYGFDLITWSGHLCVTGDCGTFVFRRVEDMFSFFRMPEGNKYPSGNKVLSINPGYWHEKVLAEERHGGCKKYSEERFREVVKSDFDTYFESYDHDWKDECWQEIEDQVLTAENEYQAFEYAMNFRFNDFDFQDFWERSLKEYTFDYLWCLYAIVWGILQYDTALSRLLNAGLEQTRHYGGS
jgi:hypothetical protein